MATDFLKPHTLYFNDFEAREAAFNRSVSHLIPCKYNGPQRFRQEFNRIINEYLPLLGRQTTAYITGNPRDCLAFGTTRQVLAAARMAAGASAAPGRTIETTAREFSLSHTLDQPIRTLSGGETVKLALAKTFSMLPCSRQLSIAGPFCWLSRKNMPILEKTVSAYQNMGLPVTLFALEGEDDFGTRGQTTRPPWPGRDLFFEISTRAAELNLGKPVFDLGAPPQSAAIGDSRMQLRSPCLIQGDNGQGKSLLAKALSGAVKTRGHIALNGQQGSAGLLFQDVINQTLLRSFGSLTKSVGRGGRAGLKQMFDQILNDYHAILGDAQAMDADDFNARRPSLLLIKIMLTAVRLCDRPNALILDEPDWGLTRRSAEALVQAVVHCAHAAATPVLLISHKPWWRDLVRSRIRVEKKMQAAGSNDPRRFTIFLTPDKEN